MFIELQNSVKEQFPFHFWFPRYEIVGRGCLCFGVEFTIFHRFYCRDSFSHVLVLLHLLRILYSLGNFCGYLNFFFCCLICLFMNEKNRNYVWLFLTVLIHPNITHTHTNTHTTHRNRNGKAIIFGWSNDETIDIACKSHKTSERYRGTSGEKKEVSFDLFIIYFPIRKGVRGER